MKHWSLRGCHHCWRPSGCIDQWHLLAPHHSLAPPPRSFPRPHHSGTCSSRLQRLRKDQSTHHVPSGRPAHRRRRYMRQVQPGCTSSVQPAPSARQASSSTALPMPTHTAATKGGSPAPPGVPLVQQLCWQPSQALHGAGPHGVAPHLPAASLAPMLRCADARRSPFSWTRAVLTRGLNPSPTPRPACRS